MEYLLLATTVLLLEINYVASGGDFFNPAVVFCFMVLINSLMCCYGLYIYDIELHGNTVAVIVTGLIVFTVVNLFSELLKGNKNNNRKEGTANNKLYEVVLSKQLVIMIVVFEIMVSFSMNRYIRNVVSAYYGTSGSLADIVGYYNYLVKNHGEEFRALAVRSGRLYSLGWPLCCLLSVVLSSSAFNNYMLTRRLDVSFLVPAFLPIVASLLTGSRSTAFRLITAMLCSYIIIYRYYVGSYKIGNERLIRRLFLIAVLCILMFNSVVYFMGRNITASPLQYFIAYLGGPTINLELYLRNPYHSSFFGQETFRNIYQYIGDRFHISSLLYDLNIPYLKVNGFWLGNVYTMYYMFIEDFGYWGIVPLTAIIAIFYIYLYRLLSNMNRQNSVFGPTLFIYSYLFNDLIMLMFSNRFYENILRTTTIRFYVWLIIVWFVYMTFIKKGEEKATRRHDFNRFTYIRAHEQRY